MQWNEFGYIVHTDAICHPYAAIAVMNIQIVNIVLFSFFFFFSFLIRRNPFLRCMRSNFTHFVRRQIGPNGSMAFDSSARLEWVHLFILLI